jgi:hypothetical protein
VAADVSLLIPAFQSQSRADVGCYKTVVLTRHGPKEIKSTVFTYLPALDFSSGQPAVME